MKLDNRGFGLKDMLFWILVMIIALLVSIYYISKFYSTSLIFLW